MTKVRSKSELKGKLILEAATELFTELGFAATSMDQIAKKSQVSKQTVYSHFGSKDELFSSAISQKCDTFQFKDISQADLSEPSKTFYQLAMNFYDLVTSKEALAVHRICCFESKTYPQLSELFYAAGPAIVMSEFTQLMSRLGELDGYEMDNPKYAAMQFISMLKGESWLRIELNLKEQLPRTEVESYIKFCVERFLKSYRL